MDLQTRKLSFIQDFLRVQNEDIISRLEKMLKKGKAKLYEKNLEPMSLETFNSDIDQSLDDSANNRVISSDKLLEEFKLMKWPFFGRNSLKPDFLKYLIFIKEKRALA